MKSKELKSGREAARKELIKSEVMTFRLPSDELEKLYDLADEMNVRVTVMIRDWILERLNTEKTKPNKRNVPPDLELSEVKRRLAIIEEVLFVPKRKSTQGVRESKSGYAASNRAKNKAKKTK
jgi:hypothetical protein